MSLAYNTGKYVYVYFLYIYILYIYVCLCVYVCICIYEQKFIMAEIMRMRMFKMLLTSV